MVFDHVEIYVNYIKNIFQGMGEFGKFVIGGLRNVKEFRLMVLHDTKGDILSIFVIKCNKVLYT